MGTAVCESGALSSDAGAKPEDNIKRSRSTLCSYPFCDKELAAEKHVTFFSAKPVHESVECYIAFVFIIIRRSIQPISGKSL